MLRRFSMRSLTAQFVAAIVASTLLAGGLVGVVAVQEARSAVRGEVLTHSLASADFAADLVADYLAESEATAGELADRSTIRELVGQSAFAETTPELEHFMAGQHLVSNVALFDLTGTVRASGNSDKSGLGRTNAPDQDWFREVVRTGQPYLGMASAGRVFGKPRVPYGVPLYDNAHQLRGVMLAGITLGELTTSITRVDVGQQASTSLIDVQHQLTLSQNDPNGILQPPSAQDTDAMLSLHGQRGATEIVTADGQTTLAAFAPIPGLDWGILIEQPGPDAFAPVEVMVRTTSGLVLLALLAASAIGAALAWSIGRPLRRLRAAAEAMASGDLTRRAAIARYDEVGDLGKAFDHMADRLADTVRRLEEDIEARQVIEEQLREGQERFRAIFDNSPIGINVLNVHGYSIQANRALQETVGYSQDELQQMRFIDYTHPEDHDRDRARLEEMRSATSLPVYHREKRYIHRDGRTVWVSITSAAVADTAGRPQFFITLAENITERKQAEAALAHQALHDALTGLPNRILLHERLAHTLRAAQDRLDPFALLLLDLDRFKDVNDTLGHHAGDQLLQEVARRLCETLRPTDTVARLGGDEFAVLLPGTDAQAAPRVASMLAEALERPIVLDGQEVTIGASIGITFSPEHGTEATTLFRRADVAMYAAKQAHRTCMVYAPDQDQENSERLALVSAFRRAIGEGELVLHYQPKLDCESGQLVGVEALARWQHPQQGLIPPDRFIPLAEQTGLIKALTRWALETALRQCRAWQDCGLRIPVAVNLSAHDVQDAALPELVDQLLTRWGIPATWLQVELTESALIADPVQALDVLTRLSETGVRVAIDDFGTGYSSLAYLKRLPIHEIKIDRVFVRDMVADADDRAIVRSTVELGHNLGLEVVAEGVEDQATLELLRLLGCDVAQGYHLGCPVPAADLIAWCSRLDVRPAA